MPRREKGRTREDLVVQAAAAAIAELGLANVRVSDVAERAGMTPGHVTYYFPAKNDLLMLAIRRSTEALTAEVVAELGGIDDPWDRLDRLVRRCAAAGPGDPGWVLWLQVWSTAADDPEVAQVCRELDGRRRVVLADVIRYGVARGCFVTDDPDGVALQLSSTIDGLSTQLALGSAGLTRDLLLAMCRRAAGLHLGLAADRPDRAVPN